VQQARAVWRDGGSSPAETAVRTWKLLHRRNVSEAATSQSRWDVVRHSGGGASENEEEN